MTFSLHFGGMGRVASTVSQVCTITKAVLSRLSLSKDFGSFNLSRLPNITHH